MKREHIIQWEEGEYPHKRQKTILTGKISRKAPQERQHFKIANIENTQAETGKDWTRSERTERPHQGHFFKLLLLFHSKNFHFKNVLHYRKCIVLKVFSENTFSHYSSCLINKASLDSDTQYFIYFYLSVLQKYQKLIQYFQKTKVKLHGLGKLNDSVLYKDCQTNLLFIKRRVSDSL